MRKLPKAGRQLLRLNAVELATAYHEQRCSAPRRLHGYFSSSRTGFTPNDGASNRAEEHLAAQLYRRGELTLPDASRLKLLDYQFPLKSARGDAGVGKVDLLGLFEDGVLAVIELKTAENPEDRRIALVEGLIYTAIVEANLGKIAADALQAKNRQVAQTRPRLLLIAPVVYWSRTQGFSSTSDLRELVDQVSLAVPLDIQILSLGENSLVSVGPTLQ